METSTTKTKRVGRVTQEAVDREYWANDDRIRSYDGRLQREYYRDWEEQDEAKRDAIEYHREWCDRVEAMGFTLPGGLWR